LSRSFWFCRIGVETSWKQSPDRAVWYLHKPEARAGADRNGFGAEEIQLLSGLANELAFGIATLRARAEHERSAERLRRGMESTIEALAGTLELRDAYTAGHQRRVAALAAAIAKEMALAEDEIRAIHLAATVHDLGEIQVPAEILAKPARLTKLEFELIKTHPQAG
jgi:HD-GYP domain-containing protein (c-di-GMP phosphodiesterase class II)